MENTINQRLRLFKESLGLSTTAFAEVLGTSQSAMSLILSGKRPLSRGMIARVRRSYPSLNEEWLLNGEGNMLNEAGVSDVDGQRTASVSYAEGIPYYDYEFSAGFDSLADDSASERPVCLINAPWLSRATLCCRAYGDSMRPEINSGDILALRRVEDFRFIPYGEVYGIITTEGLHTVKRVRRSRLGDDYLLLVPTNPDYDPQDIPISTIMHLYRVIGTIKLF